MCVGGIVLALRQDVPLSGAAAGHRAGAGIVVVRLIIRRMRPLFRSMQDAHRQGQPGAARADHRHPGDPRLRPRRPRAGALRGGQHRADRRVARRRPADGADVPDRHAGRERVQRRGAVVRRPPHRRRRHADRRADRVPQLPDADPDVGDDGHLHVHDGAARRGLRRAHRGGARHRVERGPARRARSPTLGRHGQLELRDVEFRYPGAEEPVLRGINLVGPARRDHRDHRQHRQRQDARCST